jgi:saccharopine dehydrogenase-like NADP-dependent oxidoreductase
MGLLADKYLKGVRNVSFRFGGPHCELAKNLYDMGLLSGEPVELDGAQVVPMQLISKLTPPAPKYREEIEQVLAEGMVMEEGAFLVRVEGMKDGSAVRIDSYVNAPDLHTSFEKAGITHESYYTGQGAFLFTKMLVHGRVGLTGVFPPEALDAEARAYYLKEAAKLDITVDEVIQSRLY